MEVELQTTYTALGFQEGSDYHKEPDCLETVKDLIRFLKREDDKCAIRRQLGDAQIVQKDLVQLILQYSHERELLDAVIRLLVNLTQPARLCFSNDVPLDKMSRNYFLQIEAHLQCYKEAFVNESLFAVFAKNLGDLLQLDWEHRQEEDRLLIERMLLLLRNILHVPPDPTQEQRTDDDASIHDQVIWALHVSGLEDLLLYLASSEKERQYALHVLEIISLIFREQTAEQLASAGMSRSMSQREKDERELAMMVEKEKLEKKANFLKFSSRHSRFGGTFTVTNMKSISSSDLIYHRSLGNVQNMSFDYDKKSRKKPRSRRPITAETVTRKSTLSIRLFLRDFCMQFLDNCYNPLMYSVKDALLRARGQENDETYYLWSMRFFMEFNRRNGSQVALVSETMSVPTFHYVQTNLQNYHDMIQSDKKEAITWSRRLLLALRAYRELLETMSMMDTSADQKLKDSSKVMKGNIFYMMEYRDVFLSLLQKFDETKQSRAFLKELIESTHLYLKMLDLQCKNTGHLVVQGKKKSKQKKKPAAPAAVGPSNLTDQQLEELWDTVSGELSSIFQGRSEIDTAVAPFDAASELDIDEQRVTTMRKIQDCLRENQPGTAVAMFRAAREVWPEGQFGQVDISPEDEFMALREVFFADLPRPEFDQNVAEVPKEITEENYEEDEEDQVMEYSEQDFNFQEFIARFARPPVVKACVTLLTGFDSLTPHTLHCVLKLLHRIGYDCHMIGMLFQASLFRIFQKVLLTSACKAQRFAELANFAKHVLRRFFAVAKTNNKIFVELFFWKGTKDATDVTEGYGASDNRSKKSKQIWTEEQDDELRQLFEQFQHAEASEGDVADYIVTNLIDRTKTRRQVVRQLVRLELIGGAQELKKKKSGSGRQGQTWTEEEVLLLEQLHAQFKENNCPISGIMANLKVKRSKLKVIEKLLELGFISDRSEVMRRKKGGKGGGVGEKGEGEEMMEMVEGRQDKAQSVESELEDESRMSAPSSGESESENDDDGGDDDEAPAYIIQIRKMAKKARNHGLSTAVLWVQGCLNRTADDREEDDDDEPIPLVPLSDDQEQSMDVTTFQKLLRRLGVQPPASEQEQFWRISGKLKPVELRSRAAALSGCHDNDGPMKRKGGDKLQALKALAKERRAPKVRRERQHKDTPVEINDDSDDDDMTPALEPSDSEPANGSKLTNGDMKRQSSKRILIDSNDESDDERLVIDTDDRSRTKSSKRPKLIASGDDSDINDDMSTNHIKNKLSPAAMETNESDSYDSDIDDAIPLRRATKRATIESDSDG